MPPSSRILWICLKPHRRIVVDIGPYSFVFRGQSTNADVACVAVEHHGRSRGTIDQADYEAESSRVEAGKIARQVLRIWAVKCPTVSLEDISETIVWPEFFSSHPEVTRAIEVEIFLMSLPFKIPLFPPDQSPLP